MEGSQWPVLAVRRFALYDTFLHELGHLQVIQPKATDPDRRFAREPKAQDFADYWRGELWSAPFDHPDPVHNPPSKEETELLEAGWIESHLAYKKGHRFEQEAVRKNRTENLKQACSCYQRSVELYPGHALALERLGRLTYAEFGDTSGEGSLQAAVGLFCRALAIDRTLPDANLYLALALARLGERGEASSVFEQAIRVFEPSHIAIASYAEQLGSWGETSEAERLFKKALKKDPRCSYTLPRYAEFLLSRRDDPDVADAKQAIDLLKRFVANKPNDAKAHYRLGVAYARLDGSEAEAIVHLRRSIEADPNKNPASELLSQLERNAVGSCDEAIAKYSEILRVDLEGAALHFKRANAWSRTGEYDNAIAEYTHSLRLDPENARAYFSRSYAWHSKGEYDNAIADLDEVLQIEPDAPNAHGNRGLAWKKKGEYDKAIEDYGRVIELKPDSAEAHHDRAKVWDDMGDYDEAIKDYARAIQLDPDQARVLAKNLNLPLPGE